MKKFIIVDEDSKPMSWDQGSHQLCYNDDERWRGEHNDAPFPLTIYSKKQALEVIRKSLRNRKRWHMSIDNYYLMPVK